MTFATNSSSPDLKEVTRELFAYALVECSIDRAFDRHFRFICDPQGSYLLLSDPTRISLAGIRRICLVAAGKAAAAMLSALLSRLPNSAAYEVRGVLIAPKSPPNIPATIQFFAGGHPAPNAASFAGAAAALKLMHSAAATASEALCIFLISGGTSSMMELPLDPAITLEETAAFHQALVHSGATIVEMNCVRKHFSAVKGGRLALAAKPARMLTLLVSDVPAAHLDALGSGPTVPDSSTVAQCREVLKKYDLPAAFPAVIGHFFSDSELAETPKSEELISPTFTLLDSDHFAELTRARAAELGFHAVIDNTCDDWQFDRAAEYLLERIRELRLTHSRVCLISAGEVAVRLPRTLGPAVGGRNQHFALYLATQLTPADSGLAVLSAGTDGVDGNSVAAGAVIDGETISEGLRASALAALASFDSSTWLTGAGAAIVTGATGQNLRDVRILLAG